MEQILDMQRNGGSFDQLLKRNGSGGSGRNGIAKPAKLFKVAFVRFTALPQNFILAGDCYALEVIDDVGFTVAEDFDPLFGKHRLIDHWENAQLTGRIAGANMAGQTAVYEAVNHFNTHAFGLDLTGWGESRLVDRRHIRGNENVETPDFIEIGVAADGRIAQVIAVGHREDSDLLEALVRNRVNVEGHEESLKDPAQSLRDLL